MPSIQTPDKRVRHLKCTHSPEFLSLKGTRLHGGSKTLILLCSLWNILPYGGVATFNILTKHLQHNNLDVRIFWPYVKEYSTSRVLADGFWRAMQNNLFTSNIKRSSCMNACLSKASNAALLSTCRTRSCVRITNRSCQHYLIWSADLKVRGDLLGEIYWKRPKILNRCFCKLVAQHSPKRLGFEITKNPTKGE